MRAYPKALSDAHAPKPWLSVQTDPSAESSSVVPATSAWWAQRTAPLRATATTAKTPALPRKCAFSSMRAYPKVLNDAHAPKPWLSVQTMTRAESLSVVPAATAWWAQRTAPLPATAPPAAWPRKCSFSSMRAYLHALSDEHAPKPWLSVQTGPRAESLSVVPATTAWWAQRTAPSPVTAKTAG